MAMKCVCDSCGISESVLTTKDVPVSNSSKIVYDLPVYVCVGCNSIVAMPPYSVDKIKEILNV